MTKKDYVIIARSIWRSGYVQDKNKICQEAREKMRHLIADDLSSELKQDNPNFDYDKFMTACGF